MSTLSTYNLKHPDTADDQITFTSGGDINLDNGAVYIDSTNNRLGIGTTTPSRPIHLRTTTNPMLFLESSDGIADIIGADPTGSTRFRSDAGAMSFWTGGDASSDNATNSSRALSLDANGRVIAGADSASEASVAFQLKTVYNASGNNQKLSLLHTQFSATTSSVIEFNRSRDNFGGDSAVIDDSQLGAISFRGYDGTQYSEGAAIKSFVDANPGDGDMPARLEFQTSNDGEATPRTRFTISGSGRMGGQARYVERVLNLLYARLVAHGGCSSGGPSGTFTDFDGSEPAFITVSRTTTTATSGYSFIGDGAGNAFSLFVGCGDNPVFGTHSKDSDAPEFRSWVLVDNQFVSALGGAPTNATRASLPTTP